jgi:hypothetical protein
LPASAAMARPRSRPPTHAARKGHGPVTPLRLQAFVQRKRRLPRGLGRGSAPGTRR